MSFYTSLSLVIFVLGILKVQVHAWACGAKALPLLGRCEGEDEEWAPPEEGLTWATAPGSNTDPRLDGQWGAGPLALVSLGGGAGGRWARALHARGAASLLLWAPAEDRAAPLEGGAPPWLQGCSAYVLTARRLQRVRRFLATDTANAVFYEHALWAPKQYVDLQLHWAARVVVAVAAEAETGAEWREGRRALLTLWLRHQCLRSLLLQLRGRPGQRYWTALAIDVVHPLRPARSWRIPASSSESSAPGSGQASSGLRWLHGVAALRARDLGGRLLTVYYVSGSRNRCQWVRLDGQLLRACGVGYLLRREMERRLNLSWVTPPEMHQLASGPGSGGEWSDTKVNHKLVSGQLDVSDAPLGDVSHAWAQHGVGLLPASLESEQAQVLVPRASPLPAWSLPLRVFGADVWAALATAALCYALAWRAVARQTLAEGVAAALRAFSSCGGAPQGRVTAAPQRLMLAGALLASAVVVAAAYQGRLFTLITDPERYAEIDTFQQLADSGLLILAQDDWFLNLVDPTLKRGRDEFSPRELSARRAVGRLRRRDSSMEEIERAWAGGRRFAWLTTDATWRRDRLTLSGAHRLRAMAQGDGLRHFVLPTRRNWPWTRLVNRQLLALQAAGLPSKWEADYFSVNGLLVRRVLSANRSRLVRASLRNPTGPSEDDGPRVLRLGDVRPHLQMLSVGLLLAAAALAAEIWLKRRQRRRTSVHLRPPRSLRVKSAREAANANSSA